nr:MAG TPA: hypothetical protein [Caudoviricetes sp.]
MYINLVRIICIERTSWAFICRCKDNTVYSTLSIALNVL